ncbi:MAG: RNA polymerase sigma factor, partial [Polyangiaceae bacterium]
MTTIDSKQDQATEHTDPTHLATATAAGTEQAVNDNAERRPFDHDAERRPGNDNAAQHPANGNALARVIADTTALAVHPDFVARVRGTLVRFGRRRTLEDDIPEVQTRALEAARVGPMPPDLPRWKALGRTIAKRYAIDEHLKRQTSKKYDTGLCEEPDAFGPIEIEGGRDPVDTKRYLAVLKDLFDRGKMPEHGAEILWGEAEDVPQKEIAGETGLTPRQVKQRLRQMRERFARRLDELGLRDGV